MNTRYAASITFGPARSTHRNNGRVVLGIAISLKQQAIAIPVQGEQPNVQIVYAQPLKQPLMAQQPVYQSMVNPVQPVATAYTHEGGEGVAHQYHSQGGVTAGNEIYQ